MQRNFGCFFPTSIEFRLLFDPTFAKFERVTYEQFAKMMKAELVSGGFVSADEINSIDISPIKVKNSDHMKRESNDLYKPLVTQPSINSPNMNQSPQTIEVTTICSKCGKKSNAAAKFCPACGTRKL